MDWFHVSELEPGVHAVAEPGHVTSWLIRGRDRDVLLDTGLGLVSIRPAVDPVARGPLTVVNSHYHFDHVGGNAEFEERLIHEAGVAPLAARTPVEVLQGYARLVDGLHGAWEELVARDRRPSAGFGFFLVGPDEVVRPWPPPGVDLETWRVDAPPPTGILKEGDVIDLGDRTLRVLHTPGHAPDHVCLLDEKAGILFAQDQAYYGPHLVSLPDSDLGDWARSARRLADEVASSIRVVYAAHCLRPALPPRILRELAEAGERVLARETTLVQAAGIFGEPVLVADFGHFTILVKAD